MVNWGLSLFSVSRSDCLELYFKQISYLVDTLKLQIVLKRFLTSLKRIFEVKERKEMNHHGIFVNIFFFKNS